MAGALRGPDVAYVLVTTPDPLSVREVLYFADRLREQSMRRDAFVVNRVHPVYGDVPDVAVVDALLAARGLALGPFAAERLCRVAEEETRLGKMDQLHLLALEGALEDETTGGSIAVHVPAFPFDIYDLQRLARRRRPAGADLTAGPPVGSPRGIDRRAPRDGVSVPARRRVA